MCSFNHTEGQPILPSHPEATWRPRPPNGGFQLGDLIDSLTFGVQSFLNWPWFQRVNLRYVCYFALSRERHGLSLLQRT